MNALWLIVLFIRYFEPREDALVGSLAVNFATFLYVHDFGPRSRNDLDLQYSLTFINSIRCLLLPTFRSLAAIVSEKIHFFHFFL